MELTTLSHAPTCDQNMMHTKHLMTVKNSKVCGLIWSIFILSRTPSRLYSLVECDMACSKERKIDHLEIKRVFTLDSYNTTSIYATWTINMHN